MAGTLESRARYSPSFVRPVCGLRLTRARFSFATNSAFSIDPTGSFPRQIIFAYMDNLHIYEYIYIRARISRKRFVSTATNSIPSSVFGRNAFNRL